MTEQNEKKTGGSISISTVLFIVFLVLKLTGVISWSWWWVTAPLWIPTILVVILITIICIARKIIIKKKIRENRVFRKRG